MSNASKTAPIWTADAFLATDQHEFGPAWRYELIDGLIVGHAAPTPQHGAICAGLNLAIGTRLRGSSGGCRPELGSGAAPVSQQCPTARIPDMLIRCDDMPRVMFEVISPEELENWQHCDRKRQDLQGVQGVAEIIEIYQD